jgi:hypothetical protein
MAFCFLDMSLLVLPAWSSSITLAGTHMGPQAMRTCDLLPAPP